MQLFYCFCYRLISSTDDISDTLDDMMKKTNICSDEDEQELNACLAKDLIFQKNKSKLRVQYRGKDVYDSDSELDSDEKIDTNGDSSIEYKTNNLQADLSKYSKFSKSFNDIVHANHDASEIREQSDIGKLKDAQLQRMSDHILDHIENIEIPQQSAKKWLETQFLEDNGIDNSSIDIKKGDYIKEKDEIYLEDKPLYTDTDTSSNKDYCDTSNEYKEIKNLSSSERGENISQQIYEEESTANSNESTHIVEEYLRPKVEKTSSTIHQSNEETLNKNNFNVEIKNKLNASLETGNVDTLSTNKSRQTEQTNNTKTERVGNKQINVKKKAINYDKEKLLATMKAIDDNENIEYLNQGFKNHSTNRMQITENLYRGLPTHSKPKRDIIKDIFEDNHVENKVRGACSKSH